MRMRWVASFHVWLMRSVVESVRRRDSRVVARRSVAASALPCHAAQDSAPHVFLQVAPFGGAQTRNVRRRFRVVRRTARSPSAFAPTAFAPGRAAHRRRGRPAVVARSGSRRVRLVLRESVFFASAHARPTWQSHASQKGSGRASYRQVCARPRLRRRAHLGAPPRAAARDAGWPNATRCGLAPFARSRAFTRRCARAAHRPPSARRASRLRSDAAAAREGARLAFTRKCPRGASHHRRQRRALTRGRARSSGSDGAPSGAQGFRAPSRVRPHRPASGRQSLRVAHSVLCRRPARRRLAASALARARLAAWGRPGARCANSRREKRRAAPVRAPCRPAASVALIPCASRRAEAVAQEHAAARSRVVRQCAPARRTHASPPRPAAPCGSAPRC